MSETVFSSQPWIKLTQYRLRGNASWDELDEQVSRFMNADALAVPSVRVAALWILEFLTLNRHADHILVPRFMGRCILNALSRRAFPVLTPTPATKVALIVHQFGFLQNLSVIEDELAKLNMDYIEDSPAGLGFKEVGGGRSLGRLIALSKILPILKGGVFVSMRQDLMQFIRMRRASSSPLSWVILAGMACSRRRSLTPLHMGWVDAIYELYPLSPSDNWVIRNNIRDGLLVAESFQHITEKRLDLVRTCLGQRALLPDLRRLSAVVPVIPDGVEEDLRTILMQHQMDSSLYNFDEAANLLHPKYRRVFLIPLNPMISSDRFESLVAKMGRV